MKVKTIIKLADVLDDTRKMPCDMHDLDNHYYPSESQGNLVKLAEMDIVHLVRAFKKGVERTVNHVTDEQLITQNDDLVNANKNLGNRVDYLTKGIQDGFISGVDDLEKIEELTKENAELKFQIEQEDRNQTVSKEAYDIAWDNNKLLKKEYEESRKTYAVLLENYNTDTGRCVWKDRYEKEVEKSDFWHRAYVERCTSSTGHNYVFSEIPNDCDGQQFTDSLKKYLNKDTYKMRVRGQYLKDEVKETEGWRKYERGQPIEQSKCLRVYLDKK